MKSLNVFANIVLQDLEAMFTQLSTTRDQKTVTFRVKHEGLSFLTITLANFGRDFERALEQGYVDSSMFAGFSRAAGLPKFLRGFLSQVFDTQSGRLLDTPCIISIRAIRQFTLMWAKMDLQCSRKREQDAISRYVKCEQEMEVYDANFSELREEFIKVSQLLWMEFFTKVDKLVYDGEVLPKHGSGATADGVNANRKYDHWQWTDRLEKIFPSSDYLIPSYSMHEALNNFHFFEPGKELPVKVITVPKTLKTPRIIAMEPVYMQYIQQGILELLVQEMRHNDNTAAFVLNDTQEHNRVLSCIGSQTGLLATLDLSEASDRVSNLHVQALLNRYFLKEAVDACRSRKADVPSHGIITLRKFASMGSALCFPFESLVFTTVIFMAIQRTLNRKLTKKDIKSFYGKVRVYGDDIIIPTEYVQPVIQLLETFGFKVNRNKSFWTGKFRESCGEEYFDGFPVSITKIRSKFPISRADVSELVSTVAFRNNLVKSPLYLERTIGYLDKKLSNILGEYPRVYPNSPILGRHSVPGPFSWYPDWLEKVRLCPKLFIPLVRGAIATPQLPTIKLDGYGALMKWYLKRQEEPFAKDHLKRSGRPVSAKIKYGWYSVGYPMENEIPARDFQGAW